jgi:aspartokinase
VTAVAGRKDTVELRAAATSDLRALDAILDGLGPSAGAPVRTRYVSAPEPAVAAQVHLENMADPDAWVARLAARVPGVEVVTGLGTVTIVGPNLVETPRPLRTVLATLRDLGTPPLSLDATAETIVVTVASSEVDSVMRALHDRLILG